MDGLELSTSFRSAFTRPSITSVDVSMGDSTNCTQGQVWNKVQNLKKK